MLTSAAFAVTSDWGTGFGGQVTITNTQSTAVKNWTLAFTWDRTIAQIWDGTITSHRQPARRVGQKVGLGDLAFWSLARDQEDPNGALSYAEDNSSSLVQTPYEFSDAFNIFTD